MAMKGREECLYTSFPVLLNQNGLDRHWDAFSPIAEKIVRINSEDIEDSLLLRDNQLRGSEKETERRPPLTGGPHC